MSSNTINVPHNFVPRGYQLKLFQALDGIVGRPETQKKRAFLKWHRRAGKDHACLAYMISKMVQQKGIYYYFLPNYQQGRKIIWEGIGKYPDGKLGMKLLEMIPKELIVRQSNQEMLIELTNGSIFRVIGTDNVDSIVGTNPVGCIFSEYSLQDPDAWEFIRPILAENGGWAIFNGTPRGRNHMYELDINVRKLDSWYYSELQTLWDDRPNYSGVVNEEAIQGERDAGMDEDTIEQEYGVSYSAGVKGAFYSDQIAKCRAEDRMGHYPVDDHRWVDTFWDLGVDDSTAVWFRQVDGNRIMWVDYHEDNQKDIAHYVRMLVDKGYNFRTHYLPHDGGNRTIQTMMGTDEILRSCCEQAGISADVVVTPRMPIQDGINAVRSRFSRYYFDEGLCADGIQKLELYHRRWDKKRKVYMKEPVHDWTSHCADAIRTEALAEEFGEDDPHGHFTPPIIKDYDPYGG
jgi:phage terminase large subunit